MKKKKNMSVKFDDYPIYTAAQLLCTSHSLYQIKMKQHLKWTPLPLGSTYYSFDFINLYCSPSRCQ